MDLEDPDFQEWKAELVAAAEQEDCGDVLEGLSDGDLESYFETHADDPEAALVDIVERSGV